MQVYPNRFADSLTKGLGNCYLVFGDEPQQKFESIELLRTKARENGYEERTVLVADSDFQWQQLIEATQSLSLFSSQQYIELELPTGKPGTEGGKILTELASSLSQDTLLLVHGPKIGKDVQKTKWFKALDNIGVFVHCYPLEGKALASWIRQQADAQGVQIDHNGVQFIMGFSEGNMMAAHQELVKLALLYPGQMLDNEKLEASLVDQSRFKVFQLIDVMLAGDTKRCIKILYRLESEGIEPNIIIWALIREWKTLSSLVALKSSGQPIQWQRFGVWRNRQGFYDAALSRMSPSLLNNIQSELEAADLAFKQSVLAKPYIKLAHLCCLFMGIPLQGIQAFEA